MDLAEKYKGKNKRLAFNSLLRGSKPISAGLRKGRSSSDNSLDSQNSADFEAALALCCGGAESERLPGYGDIENPLFSIGTTEPLREADDGPEEKEAPMQNSPPPTSPPAKVVPRLAPPPSQQEQQKEQNPMCAEEEVALEEGEWGDFVGDDLRRQQVEEQFFPEHL